ncbi:MAG: hypothetical protein KTR15_00330 [Phycisphaeraceae bacterium]|nr:hypothetical protein [Phycisphaeraceae bacterium]
MNPLALWDNPLVMRGIRTRLRMPMLLSWGIVTIVASMFLYILVSGNAIKFDNVTPAEAARDAILPLLIMQGLILMVLGTGAVAGGMARERTYRLLDYQRLTPMAPSAKIVGLLIGLPIREYFMFAVSLPFVFYAAHKGGLSFGVLIQFYIVFITSAVVYHMTGLAAGMIVDKPWQAGTLSQGLVVILYVALPQVSNFGFTFFEHLTARPVFYGLVDQHLLPDGIEGAVQGMLQDPRYSVVPFFGMKLPPLLFSLAVQGFAILTLYVMVYRKWRSEQRISFSKGYALLFFAVIQVFLVGSVLPFIQNDAMFAKLVESYVEIDNVGKPQQTFIFAMLLITLLVSGCAALLTLFLCTPNWYQSLAGYRRAHRKGKAALRWDEDAASGLSVAAGCLLMTGLSFFVVYQAADNAGRIGVSNPLYELLLPLLLFAGVLFTMQQVIEQFSEQVLVMVLFACWLVPVLGAIIVWTVGNSPIEAVYLALFFPFVGLYLATALLMTDTSTAMSGDVLPDALAVHGPVIVVLSIMVYGLAALVLLSRAWRRWRRIKGLAGVAVETSEDMYASGPAGSPVPAYAPVRAEPTNPGQ